MGKVRTIAGDPTSNTKSVFGVRDIGLDIEKGEELGELNREISARQIELTLSESELPTLKLSGIKIKLPNRKSQAVKGISQ